jgi:SAM-dependent methyltransferase
VGVGLIYRSPLAYGLAMHALYGRHEQARTRAVADLIPDGASVLDLCCGTGLLFRRHLRGRGTQYLGLDANPRFVASLRRQGAEAEVRELKRLADLPAADCVVMLASLYHFLPDPHPILDLMERAARHRVIVSEPVRNLAASSNVMLAAIARKATRTRLGAAPRRFDERSLDALFVARDRRPSHSFLIPGGRDKVYMVEIDQPRDPGASP